MEKNNKSGEQRNKIIIDEIIAFAIILIKKSKNKFCGYITTILSNSGLKEKVPGLKKVLCISPKTKSKFNFDEKISKIPTSKARKLPAKAIINNFFAIFLKLNFIKIASIAKNIKNKIMEK